jgi:hypothetical protein
LAVVLKVVLNCWVRPVKIETDDGDKVRDRAVPAVMVTVAVVDWVVSANDVAVMVTVAGLGTVAGAVYSPLVLMVPTVKLPPMTPFTSQNTPELLLLTDAENCAVVFVGTDAVVGEMETLAEFVVVELELFPPPHPARMANDTMSNSRRDFIIWASKRAVLTNQNSELRPQSLLAIWGLWRARIRAF